MEMEVVLAQILFWYFLIIGSSFLFKRDFYVKVIASLLKEQWLFFGGFLALLLGFVILAIYHTWSWDLMVVVTIVGWSSILKGVISLFAPEFTARTVYAFEKKLGKRSILFV